MSARKSKPCSSRRLVAASTSRPGSTTSVVSPWASRTSTSPGTPSQLSSPPRGARRRAGPRPDLLVEADDPLHQRLRPRRAAGHVDVDRDDPVDALEDRVVVEHAAGAGAGAHRDHPLRLEHLVVDLPQRRRHPVRDAAGDDHQVGLPRRGAEGLHPEARDVVARVDDRHHLDRAAREPERVGPHRLRLRPVHRLLERRQHQRLLEVAELLLEVAGALADPQHALALEPVVGEALLRPYSHSSAPFRQT